MSHNREVFPLLLASTSAQALHVLHQNVKLANSNSISFDLGQGLLLVVCWTWSVFLCFNLLYSSNAISLDDFNSSTIFLDNCLKAREEFLKHAKLFQLTWHRFNLRNLTKSCRMQWCTMHTVIF